MTVLKGAATADFNFNNMPKLQGYILPTLATGKLWAMVTEFPDAVYQSNSPEPDAQGSTINALKEQMIATIQTEDEFSQPLILVLQRALPHRGLVEALSETALLQCSEGLGQLLGRMEVLLALLVDVRPALRTFAAEELAKDGCITAGLSEGAERRLRNLLQPLLPLLVAFHGHGDTAGSEKLSRKIAALEDELKQAKKSKERRIERLKEQMQGLTDENAAAIQRLKKNHETIERELQRLLGEKASLERQLQDQQRGMEELVAQQVDARTNAISKKWLALPLQTEKQLPAELEASDDLLRRAEAVLEAQKAQDEHTGNRLQLQAHLDHLVAMRDRLSGAAQSAIVCIPRVGQINQEVDHAISRIRKVLDTGLAKDPAAEQLMIRINQARTANELYECAAMVKSMEDLNLASVSDSQSLYDGLHRRYSLIEEKAGGPQQFTDTGWSLRGIIHRNEACLLLLDGHNLLFRLQDVFGHAYENGVPGTKARDVLVNVVRRLAAGRSNIQVKVCFDGPHQSARKEAENIEVAFSGGEGENRADNLLLGYLPLMRSMGGTCFGVTDDGAVRAQLICSGATYVPCSLFAVLLNDFQCLTELHEHSK